MVYVFFVCVMFLSGFCVFSIVVLGVCFLCRCVIVSGLLCVVFFLVWYFVCSRGMWCCVLFYGVGGSGSSGVSVFWHSVSSSCSVVFVCVFFSCMAFVSFVWVLFVFLFSVSLYRWLCLS